MLKFLLDKVKQVQIVGQIKIRMHAALKQNLGSAQGQGLFNFLLADRLSK